MTADWAAEWTETTDEVRTTWTAADLQRAVFPEPRWAIPGLVPEGLAILGGKPKVGKSWLALGWTVAVAFGRAALGTRTAEAGDALYISLEDSSRRLQQRLAAVVVGTWPARLHLETTWPRLDKGGLERLDIWLTEHPDARLVVLDTLQRVRAPLKGHDRYGEDYAAVAELQDLASTHRAALVAVHHLRKDDDPADWVDAISGSTGITGAVDTVAALFRERGRMDATLKITGRDLDNEPELALGFDAGVWTELGAAAEYRIANERFEVLELFGEQKEISARDVADALGATPEAARQRLSRMARAGELLTPRRGYYAKPPPPGPLP